MLIYCFQNIIIDLYRIALTEIGHPLLFQCLLGWQNPLTQRNMGSEELTWGTAEFPYEADNDLNAAPAKYARWMELNDTTRQAFADEFHFRRWHSIGAWIRALKL